MSNYIIVTDTGCDISPELLKEWDVSCVDLVFRESATDREYKQVDMPSKVFYDKMREGVQYKTAAANLEDFINAFEPALKEGKDVLYIGFSSGLSSTVNTGAIAGNELMEEYPDRKVITIDTAAASAGQGFLLKMAVDKRAEGLSIDDAAEYVRTNVPRLCHWFTVEDLVYLKRGGRCSAAAAFMGTVLNIKPVLHVDDEGHLIPIFKVRGRKKSIAAMAEKYDELAIDPANGEYMISHADCMEDALALEKIIEGKYGHKASLITDVGAVIGSHSGPGTLALFFVAKNR